MYFVNMILLVINCFLTVWISYLSGADPGIEKGVLVMKKLFAERRKRELFLG